MSKPGPGYYDPQYYKSSTQKNSPSAKISKAKREDKNILREILSKPGPVDYNPSENFTRTSSAAFGFGRSKRSMMDALLH